MRTVLLLIPVILLSCSKYQYLKVSSGNASLNDKNEFVAENDTVRITYNFYGNNMPVNISVFNKSNDGLMIDWSRSSVIIGENAITFSEPSLEIQGELNRPVGSSHTAVLNAKATGKEDIVFIPPQSAVNRSGVHLVKGRFIKLENGIRTDHAAGLYDTETQLARFSTDNSPIRFRIYLTLAPGDSPGQKSMVVERSFYMSEMVESPKRPSRIFPKSVSGNVGYMGKHTKSGTALGVVGGLIALGAVNAMLDD